MSRRAHGWRYIAQRLNGDGTQTTLDWDVPLSDASITTTLSGPGALSGTIQPEYLGLKDDHGRPILEKASTVLWAELDGVIRGGGILMAPRWTGSTFSLDCAGYSSYPQGKPYTDSDYYVDVDPLDLYRKIWSHLQSKRFGDIGVTLDDTWSPVRIGTKLKQREFDTQNGPVEWESGPYKLTWYQTSDLGQEADKLAEDTPFDYREKPYWDGERVRMHIELGWPRLGRRHHDLTFILGENIFVDPDVGSNEDYANEILVLGAGEGAAMIRGSAARVDGRIRSVRVVTDKSLRTKKAADAAAERELQRAMDFDDITQVVVRNTRNAPLGSYAVGDDILVQTRRGWKEVAAWCRILASTVSPDSGDDATLTLQRAGDFTPIEE